MLAFCSKLHFTKGADCLTELLAWLQNLALQATVHMTEYMTIIYKSSPSSSEKRACRGTVKAAY